jgi:sec-independent protein translocase protein TatA
MGMMKLSSLLLILLIVVLLFGTKRLRHMGEDVAEAVKSFRKGLKDDDDNDKDEKS